MEFVSKRKRACERKGWGGVREGRVGREIANALAGRE